MINSEYLKNLNNFQKEAVLHTRGPLLIVAGAGSGKTKVLTSRIANIIEKNLAFPNEILAVTFTNKAAREMQNRIGFILKKSSRPSMAWNFPLNLCKDTKKACQSSKFNSKFYDNRSR